MGRKKLEIKLIQDRNNRHVTFCKRRKGLLKKAQELSDLCDAQIVAIIFSEWDKLYEFSHGNSLAAILQQYHAVSDAYKREATGVQEPKILESARIQADRSLLQRVQRYLDELNLDPHNIADLEQLEKEYQSALVKTRATKASINTQHTMEPIRILHEKEQLLREENKLLTQQIAAMAQESLGAKQVDDNMGVNTEGNNEAQPQQTLSLLK